MVIGKDDGKKPNGHRLRGRKEKRINMTQKPGEGYRKLLNTVSTGSIVVPMA